MIQLNLLPDLKKEYLRTQRIKRGIILIAIAVSSFFVVVVLLLASFVFGVQRTHIGNLTDEIDANISTLRGIQDLDKILTVQEQLKDLGELHDGAPTTSRLFGFIGQMTPPEVGLGSMEIKTQDGTESIRVSGRGASFKVVNQFVDTIKNATYDLVDEDGDSQTGTAFSNVVLETITRDSNEDADENASFTIEFEYSPEIFSNQAQQVTLIIPEITSSVSNTERPQLFNNSTVPEATEGGN